MKLSQSWVSFALVALVVSFYGCPSSAPPSQVTLDAEVFAPDVLELVPGDGLTSDVVTPGGCQKDEDCPQGKCNLGTFTCVECLGHSDCPPGSRCSKWECIQTAQCSATEVCPDGLVCDQASGFCVECLADQDCGDGGLCVSLTCLPPCDKGCPPQWTCLDEKGVCVECLDDGNCVAMDWCNLEENLCYPDGCPAGAEGCVGNSTARCAENGSGWMDLEECPAEQACVEGKCVSGQICVPNLVSCADEYTIQTCNANGTQLAETKCPDDQRCSNGDCSGACVPDCEGKECGESNCPGYSCGECQEGAICTDDFRCYMETCEPGRRACLNGGVAICSADGVWTEGKPCPPDTLCQEGECVALPPVCEPGVRMCEGNSIVTCAPNGLSWTDGEPCPVGTVCESGVCKQLPPECKPGSTVCAGTTAYLQCLDDGTSWSEPFTCPPNTTCSGGQCTPNPQVCQPGTVKCDGASVVRCRQDGSGWDVQQQCAPGTQCVSGSCKPLTLKSCANVLQCLELGPCDAWSPDECFPECQEGAEPEAVEISYMVFNCIMEVCGTWAPKKNCHQMAKNGPCFDYVFKCTGGCQPKCEGKQCGDDGCGGSCGFCNDGATCSAQGTCQTTCVPSCLNKDCGSDGCGGSCGSCPAGSSCNVAGICEMSCQPNCAGKTCGSDGCGGICGVCGPDEACKQGACVTSLDCKSLMECNWSCADGDEACGNQCWADASPAARQQWQDLVYCVLDVCGQQPSGPCFQSSIQGACKSQWNACQSCTPACVGKQCGGDGCGGSCGNCPAGFACDTFGYCLCQPQCQNKVCGPDLCGGSCGTCPTGNVCNYQGKCVCMPKCDGKQCGPNGCGGTCGTCSDGYVCSTSGVCEPPVPPSCGNGYCQPGKGETCETCPKDCGPCNPECGDGYCTEGWEDCYSCPWDCGECPSYCGDYYCDYNMGESCDWCPQDCGPCDSYCGDYYCDYNMKEDCQWCPQDCGACNGYCGDSFCDSVSGEYCDWCPQDCGPCEGYCGDFYCDPNLGESCDWCPNDCGSCGGYCGDYYCDAYLGETCENCVNDCGQCGSSDCCTAQSTPRCDDGEVAECVCSFDPYCCQAVWDDVCVSEAQQSCGLSCGSCVPNCYSADGKYKQCGDDGCGGSCGQCPDGRTCQNGQCVPGTCVPSCVNPFGMPKACGSDGCGGVCGYCPPGTTCDTTWGMCNTSCVPNCGGKQCGSDGCGGTCGSCPAGSTCSASGTCSAVGSTCKDMLVCAQQCNYAIDCVFTCFNGASSDAQQYAQALLSCVANVCGFQPTSACVQSAYTSTCAQQYQACAAH